MATSPLEDLLQCSVCLEIYKEPKILPCHHSFCRECLGRVPQERKDGKYLIICPTCREPVQLPDKGVASLQSSFFINNLIELHKARKGPSSKPDNVTACIEHDKPRDVFCEECTEVICHVCSIRHHRAHTCTLITDCFQKHLHPIKEKLGQIKKEILAVEQASEGLQRAGENIKEQERSVEEKVNLTADELISSINQYRQCLLERTRSAAERKLAMLQLQKDEASKMIKQLRACEESVELLLQSGLQSRILESKTQVLSELNTASKSVNLECLEPAELPDIEYTIHKDIQLKIFGSVQASFVNRTFKGLNETFMATCNKRTPFVILHEPKAGSSFKPNTGMFTYQLVSSASPLKEEVCDVNHCDDICQVFFTPIHCGPHKLVINMGGYPISGSPFNINILPDFLPGSVIEGIKSPHGLAVARDGTMFVSEYSEHRVCTIQPNGRKSIFACPGPVGVAITPDGNILVVDQSNWQIKKFDPTGQLLRETKKSGFFMIITKSNAFCVPHAITVHRDGRVFVTEKGNSSVHILDQDLNHIDQKSDYTYNSATGLALDSKGNLFVTSKSNNNVVRLNLSTGDTTTFGTKGSNQGQLKHPMDIAIDKNDVVYVADTDNHRISLFNSDGQFLTCFGKKGSALGELNGPCGVAVDEGGKVYVCDTGNNRVVIYY